MFIARIQENIKSRESFSFESTLSGKSYFSLVENLKRDGWIIKIYYLWIQDPKLSILRISERVASGGHFIPDDVVIRRYKRSTFNFMNYYVKVANKSYCFDNTFNKTDLIFIDEDGILEIHNQEKYKLMIESSLL